MHKTAAEDIVAHAQSIGASGLGVGTAGNISARCDGGFLITPSGVPYEKLTADMIVYVGENGTPEGDLSPSSEWRFHHDIYASRPDAAAIMHCHSTHATALACLRRGIPAFHYMVAVAGGVDIRCGEYALFGTQALSDAAVEALEGRKACLLANHGQIAIGRSVEAAFGLAQEVEELAQQYAVALQVGEPVLLSAEEMAEVLEKFKAYGTRTEP